MRGPGAYHKLGRRDLVVGSSLALVACRVSSSPSVAPGPSAPRSAPLPMPARMLVEWDSSPAFASPRRVRGPAVSAATDLTGKVAIDGLPAAARVHYRVRFEAEAPSEWITGALTTPALPEGRSAPRDVLFAWSGDTNGQGWGIDPSRGGMPAFTALLARRPDFFISCGDAIYADDRSTTSGARTSTPGTRARCARSRRAWRAWRRSGSGTTTRSATTGSRARR